MSTTQATVDRLPQLYSQCKSWRGPLSAVMYLGLYQEEVNGLTESNSELLKKASLAVRSGPQGSAFFRRSSIVQTG